MDFIKRFVEWQNYAHYILLTIGLFIWHALPVTTYLEEMYINTLIGPGKWLVFGEMFVWYLIGFFVIDTMIHAFFWFGPRRIRWRD